jgi:hypothetical protein
MEWIPLAELTYDKLCCSGKLISNQGPEHGSASMETLNNFLQYAHNIGL